MDIVAESPRRIQNGPRRFHMAKQTRRTGRPPITPGQPKRSAFNTRLRAEVKKRLELEAERAGRSLSEEIEFRLERSFEGDEAFGGRQFRDLFRLFGNAANVIEQQTGKPYFEDWYTSVAVRAAWRRLIGGFGPRMPAEHVTAFEQALAAPVPKLPMPPIPPTPPGSPEFSLGSHHQYEQQIKDYDAAVAIYNAAVVTYKKESVVYDKAGEANRRFVEEAEAQRALGKDVAVSLLPERPKKKA